MNTTLLVDIGNSRLKWELRQQGQAVSASTVGYSDINITEIVEREWFALSPPEIVVISSVAAEDVNDQLALWGEKNWPSRFHFVRSIDAYPGVINGYVKPEQLGDDRWVTMIAAYEKYRGPVAVVDCGTAVTIDLVDAEGRHRGGWILPGTTMAINSLREKTAIPDFHDVEPNTLAARSTAEAIANGCLLTVVGAIGRIAQDLTEQPDFNKVRWVLTGGGVDRLSAAIDIDYQRIDELMMDGLQLLAEQLEQDK